MLFCEIMNDGLKKKMKTKKKTNQALPKNISRIFFNKMSEMTIFTFPRHFAPFTPLFIISL